MGKNFSIKFTNDSNSQGDACVFQKGDDNYMMMSLAWQVKPSSPHSMSEFMWSDDFCFVCGQTGQLRPGIKFDASQTLDANIENSSMVDLNFNGSFTFSGLRRGNPGRLAISATPMVPRDTGSAGIGMSRQGTIIAQAQPNWNVLFNTNPSIWMAFGNFQQGQVLDVRSMSNVVEVRFPSNVLVMNVKLNSNNTWTVTQ